MPIDYSKLYKPQQFLMQQQNKQGGGTQQSLGGHSFGSSSPGGTLTGSGQTIPGGGTSGSIGTMGLSTPPPNYLTGTGTLEGVGGPPSMGYQLNQGGIPQAIFGGGRNQPVQPPVSLPQPQQPFMPIGTPTQGGGGLWCTSGCYCGKRQMGTCQEIPRCGC